MENFVGVSVADAAENVRIGHGSLKRVILVDQRGAERIQIGAEDFQSTRIVFGQPFPTADQMKRRSLFCAHLGQ
jgi:hypothetical protein